MLVNFVYRCVAVSFELSHVLEYTPIDSQSTRLALRKISGACMLVIFSYCCVAVSFELSHVLEYTPIDSRSTRLALWENLCACMLGA
ncbi:MAG: hypothetical protein Q4E84_08300 [Clostridia bacterium]|nr:hypothetical protein [Clostridia bacterium]